MAASSRNEQSQVFKLLCINKAASDTEKYLNAAAQSLLKTDGYDNDVYTDTRWSTLYTAPY